METFSLDKVTLATVLDTRRPKESLLFPVKYRVTFMRKQAYYPSGIDLSIDEWKRLPGAKGKELKQQREIILAGFDKIKDHIKDMVKGDGFSTDRLNTRLSRGMKNSIISAFYSKVETLKRAGKIGTAEWYLYSAKSLQKYTGKDLKFSEITVDWLKKYEASLLEEEKSFTTISMYMRALQAIVNDGIKDGIINKTQYPFGKGRYEIPAETSRKLALTLSQIGKVVKCPLVTDTEKRCKDLWLFSYLCNGINMIDLLRLKYSDIENGRISFYRQKTIHSKNKEKIIAVLLSQMQEIIDRWGNSVKPDNYVFPFLRDGLNPEEERRIVKNITSLINKKMRRIGKSLGYGNISTYTARHSYATVLKRSGANIAFISESLGHRDVATTKNYLDRFEDEERIKNAALLTKF
jgi:integrase/recombinase XerD